MNASHINRSIYRLFSNYSYRLFNAFVFTFESDFLAISTSGYVWEIEVKTSRGDFKNDFKKMSCGENKHEVLQDKSKHCKPNKFCFAVPEGLISRDEVPDHAGLIIVYKSGYAQIVKQPPFLHKEKLLKKVWFLHKMLNKFYYHSIDLRRILNYQEWTLKYKQEKIDFMVV